MSYKVETDEVYGGLRIATILIDGRHRCGYVGIPESHPLFGIDYGQSIKGISRKELEKTEMGDRGIMPVFIAALDGESSVSPDLYFDVHGSITYAGQSEEYPVKTDGKTWWYGFDCAHLDDTNEKWTHEAVKTETIRFADQLIEFAKRDFADFGSPANDLGCGA